ncbi:MAG TPA: glutaredoxin family protein [Solirubrobacteraceae bacterium]|nr:glutaredoxin family protein [Solirubrobacteraceae bacterium]
MTETVRVLTLYSKPGCHLCEDALAVLRRVRAELPFELRELDISLDDALHRRYFERIPVVELDGEELFEYFVDEPALRARLR